MMFALHSVVLYLLSTVLIVVSGQSSCQDYSADSGDCTKFIRCFHNLRIKFTCPSGTAWENSLKTCVWKEYVESCGAQRQAKQIDFDDGIEMYEADPNALNNMTIGRTLSEARALGPLVTPKQYQCSFCSTGACGIVVNTVQCFCGSIQCAPATTPIQPRNPCAVNPCLNGGQCVSNGAGFICNCPATFTGNRCEAPAATPCQPNPCQNGGTCIPSGMSFLCQCPTSFIGRCCETRITTTTPYDPCLQSPCQNGGRCIPTGATYLCQCPNGYYGTRCEYRNYCIPNPCSNNGACIQTTTGYVCQCSYPFTGTNCQQMITTTTTTTTTSTTTTTTTTTNTITTRPPSCPSCVCIVTPCPVVIVTNPCLPNPCQNMGGCSVQNNAAQCWCSNYYAGYYCQFRRSARSLISKPCNKTCLNGGRCYIDELNGQARCSCPNEYYGARCEKVNRPKSCSPKNPCMNKAKCVTTKSGSQCVCQKGSSGVLCEKIQRSSNAKYCPLDCQAGGTCVYVKSTPKCRCPKGRTGRLCESRSGKSLSIDEDEMD
ncbi:unnamed protein product, partial [Adineta ricciae]